jgi:hypothetical protein
MQQDNDRRRIKSFTAFPNTVFAIAFFVILLFEVEKHGVKPFTFGLVIGWLLLPAVAVVYYNAVDRNTKKDRYGVMILTGLFFLLWIAGRLLG